MMSDTIEEKYEEILEQTKAFDDCLEVSTGSFGSGVKVKDDKGAEYVKNRALVESEISEWMANIRKSINALPASVRKSVREQHTDYNTGEEYSTIRYDNGDYEAIVGFFRAIEEAVEGTNGVLNLIQKPNPTHETLRAIRGRVLSLCRTLEVFVPEIMVTIDQQVKLVFRLREKGLPETALLIEELDQIENNLEKCAKSRTALEQVVEAFCKEKSIAITKGFYVNLDRAISAGLVDKGKRDSIAGHYSYVSRIIHGTIESNPRNTEFAVNGIINILSSFQ